MITGNEISCGHSSSCKQSKHLRKSIFIFIHRPYGEQSCVNVFTGVVYFQLQYLQYQHYEQICFVIATNAQYCTKPKTVSDRIKTASELSQN